MAAQARMHKDVGEPRAQGSASIARKLSADHAITTPGSST
jgi:hypothetical protein